MSKGFNFHVSTFGRYGTIPVQVVSSSTVGDVKAAVLKHIGAKPASAQLFALFIGSPGSPTQRLEETAGATAARNICLQRWSATPDGDARIAITDPVATHLLAEEATHYLGTGRITPSDEERELLDAYLDPSFPSERQFVEAVCKVDGYCAFEALDCVTRSSVDHDRIVIPRDTRVIVTCYPNRLEVKASDDARASWSWRKIRKWRLSESKQAEFELFSQSGGIGILGWLCIESEQAAFLLQAAMCTCTHLHECTLPASARHNNPVTRGKLVNPLQEFLNVQLFGAGPTFSELGVPPHPQNFTGDLDD